MKKKLLFLATLLMTMLFGVNVNAAEIDKTAAVKTDRAAWNASGGPVNMGGISMPEHFQNPPTIETGDVMHQTVTGLENGTYKVVLYATACSTHERDNFESDVTNDSEEYAYVYANSVQVPIKALVNTATMTPGEYTLENVEVTDGTLKLGLAKYKNGTNWHTIQIKSLVLIVDNYPAYEIALAAANETAAKEMLAAAKSALDAVIAANKDLTAESADEDLIAATEALKVATAAAEVSVKSCAIVKTGVIATNSLEGWKCTNTNTFHVNTWSNEGASDGTGMVTPFIENWVAKGSVLGDGTITYTLEGIENGYYDVSALIRVYSESGSAVTSGITFGVNDGTAVDLVTEGTEVNYNALKGIYGTYSVIDKVEDNKLVISININAATFNWVAFKNVTIAYLGTSTPEEGALNNALEAAKAIDAATLNTAVATTLANAISAAESVDKSDKDAMIAATEALNAAINAAKNLVSVKEAIDANYEVLNSTNVSTAEAFATYMATIDAWQAAWEAGTLTETVVTPAQVTWHGDNIFDDYLLSAWTIGGEQAANYDKALYINTWSTEGNTDGTNFKVPFYEYWTGDANSLGATTLQATKIGLAPRSIYKVTAWTRVRIKNGATGPTGITFNAGGASVDACAGTQVGASQFYLAEISVLGVTDVNGTLKINYEIAADNNISWLSFKNVKVEEYKVVLPDNRDFAEGTPVVVGICTYAKDCSANGTTLYNSQAVPGWTINEVTSGTDLTKDGGPAAGLFAYGSGAWNGGKDYPVPSTNPDGSAEGNALGVVAVWETQAQYTQKITLPAGNYTITVPIYNAKGGTTAPTKSLIGFIADNGTEYLAPAKSYAVNTWTTETITFSLAEETTGVLSLGYKAPSAGSGGNQHLFFDRVTISPNDDLLLLTPTILKAEAIDQTILSEDVATALSTAIAAAKAVDTADVAAVAAAMTALQTAIQAAYDAEDAIIALNAAKEAALAELVAYKEYSENSIPNEESFKTAYDQAIADAEAAIEAAETIEAVEAAVEPLEAARQTYVQNAYPINGFAFDMTFLVKNADFSAATEGWTTEGTVGKNTGQHWSGVGANQYIEPCNWNATGWTSSFKQTVVVPAGKYTVQAAGRASANVTLNLVVGDQTVAYPSNGDNGGTIATDGTEWESVEAGIAAGKSFAKGNVGYGWTYATIETVVTDSEQGITIGATSTTANVHEWASVDDFKLLLTDSIEVFESVVGIPEDGETVATDLTEISFMFGLADYAKVNAENAEPVVLIDAEGKVTELTSATLTAMEGMTNAYDLTNGEDPIFPAAGVYTVKIPAGKFLLGADEASATTPSHAIKLTYTVIEKKLIVTPASGETVETLESIELNFQGYDYMNTDANVDWSITEPRKIVIKKDGEVYKESAFDAWGEIESVNYENILRLNLGITEAGTYTIEIPEGKFSNYGGEDPSPATTLTYTVLGLENVTLDPKDGKTVATDLKEVTVIFDDAEYVKVNEENTAAVTITDAEGTSVDLAGAAFVRLGDNAFDLTNGEASIFSAEGTYTVYVPAGKFLLGADEANATTASKAFKFTYTVVEKKVIADPASESSMPELQTIELTFQGYDQAYIDTDEMLPFLGIEVSEPKTIVIKKNGEVYKETTTVDYEQSYDYPNAINLNNLALTEVGTYTIEFPEGKFVDEKGAAIPAFTLTYTVEGYQDVTADPADGSTVDTNLMSFNVTFNGATTVAAAEGNYDPIYIYDENGEYAGSIRGAVFEFAGNVATVKNQTWGMDAPIFSEAGTYTLEFPAGKFLVDEAASKVFKLTYVVEAAPLPELKVTANPESGTTHESLDRITVTFEGYEDIGWNYEFCTEKIIINKDGVLYKEGNSDNGLTEQPDAYNEFDIVAGLTEPGVYEIIVPQGYFKDNMDMSFPNPGLAGFTLTYTIAAAPEVVTKTEMLVEVERELNNGAMHIVDVDLAKICETLGIESIAEATVWGVNATTMEYVANAMATYDGWRNIDGDFCTWGADAAVFYKYFENGAFELGTFPGQEPAVGTVYNTYWAFTANEDTVVVKTAITFVEAPEVEVETVKTITINHEEMEKAAYSGNTAAFDVAEVCEALGVETLDGAETFIVNVTTGEFVMNTTDGWRDANGDAAQYGSAGEGMVCVKLNDPTSGTFDYIGAIDATIVAGTVYTAKWAIVVDNKAVVLELVITFTENPVGINGISADDIVKTEYFGMNGAALNAPAKGINIVKYTLTDGKVVTSKVYVK